MEVILLENVPKLGQKYEKKRVSAGYGRNFLIPEAKAVLATESNLKRYQKLLEDQKAKQEALKADIKDILNKAGEIILKLEGKANPQGHLFAGIYPDKIIEALEDQFSIKIEEQYLDLDEPIKNIGQHKVGIKEKPTDQKASAHLTLEITAEPAKEEKGSK